MLSQLDFDAPHRAWAYLARPTFERALKAAVHAELISTPEAANSIVANSESDNIFRRSGNVWQVSYAGETTHVEHMAGMEYIAILIRDAGTDIPALRIEALSQAGKTPSLHPTISPDSDGLNVDQRSFDDSLDVIPPRELRLLRNRQEDLRGLIEAERLRGNIPEVERLQNESEQIAEFLKSNTRPATGNDGKRYSKSRRWVFT